MINEILTLVELLRGLAQRKNELDKEYFLNFIQPSWELFCDIHKRYKETFANHQNLILQSDDESFIETFDEFLETLNRDLTLSSDLRNELGSLIKHLPSSGIKTKETHLSNFINSISDYFRSNGKEGMYKETQELRSIRGIIHSTLARLKHVVSKTVSKDELKVNIMKEKKEMIVKIKKVFENSIKQIQFRYSKVADAYYQLKKELLT